MSRQKWMTVFITSLLAASVILSAGVAPSAVSAQASAHPRPSRYNLPGTDVFPEGIAFQRSTGDFFVSSTTNGAIFRGNVKDADTAVFLPAGQDGRTTAVGLKVDRCDRLYIAGGSTGRVWVYDTDTGALLATFSNGRSTTFINDVIVTRDGTAYFTDSLAPVLYRLSQDRNGKWVFEEWLDLRNSPIPSGTEFDLNGIAASENGKYLIVVHATTGELFRVSTATGTIIKLNLGGATVINGDGLLLQGRTLYVAQNYPAQITKIHLTDDLARGTITSVTTDPSFALPTTIAAARGRLLVVNSQFDKQGGTPELPFWVSSIPLP